MKLLLRIETVEDVSILLPDVPILEFPILELTDFQITYGGPGNRNWQTLSRKSADETKMPMCIKCLRSYIYFLFNQIVK